jgi:hypothetical protein
VQASAGWTLTLICKSLHACAHVGVSMGTKRLKNSPPPTVIAPVFWAWAQQQAAPEEPLHLTRKRAIEMQLQADADLAKAMHREAFLAITRGQRR